MSMATRLAAYGDLLRNYKAVWSHHWAQRKTYRENFYTRQEAEFLPAALALQDRPDSAALRQTARLLMFMVLLILLWSVLGKVDIVVGAGGRVIPSARTKTIASVDVASVRALHVVEGQRVRAGDVLVELDSSSSDAEYQKAADRVVAAQLEMARARALIAAVQAPREAQQRPQLGLGKVAKVALATPEQQAAAESHLRRQVVDFQARMTRLDDAVARYVAALPLVRQRAADLAALLVTQDVSSHAWLEKEQLRIELEGQLADAENQRRVLLAQTVREAHDALHESQRVLDASVQDQVRASERSRLLRLTSPVDGTVQQLSVHTVGGVVPAAQPLMQVVPLDSPVEVEAQLENREVGFVQEGQAVVVKVDAFDYTKYGTVSGVVRHVSHDAIQDERRGLLYPVRIALTTDHLVVDGVPMPVTAGMAVNLNIKTGTRRVIEFVLSPLIRHQKEAMRER